MSRKKHKEKEPEKSRHIKYLLYEDNPLHMEVVDKIKADSFPYIGIRHHIFDLDGNEIISESGKPHFHIYQEFENPVHPSSLAKRYGLFDDAGKVDVQFCRCCTGRFNEALVYLTHLNAPEKELYPDSDLFGWSNLLRDYRTATLVYLDKHIDIRTALYALLDWVRSDMHDKIIKAEDIIEWIIRTPYVRYRNEKLFHDMIAEHNRLIYQAAIRDKIGEYGRSTIELNTAVGFDCSELSDDQFQSLNLEGYK